MVKYLYNIISINVAMSYENGCERLTVENVIIK